MYGQMGRAWDYHCSNRRAFMFNSTVRNTVYLHAVVKMYECAQPLLFVSFFLIL